MIHVTNAIQIIVRHVLLINAQIASMDMGLFIMMRVMSTLVNSVKGAAYNVMDNRKSVLYVMSRITYKILYVWIIQMNAYNLIQTDFAICAILY